ncbi:hypothetical protein F0L17_06680 [Streptomyces sp. TRM43335]|uniref:Uncharacterized protein n=1 Tax=Streptomyces taklimakanensis TaxID=2569853 RepID=A0A6G2B9C0_9ACTN|nr:hypothetical protein [Streptomyces taklimakanensis]MTE18824.1 hypothetical protein [Streptomyces taklimakanensis]
MTLRTVDAAPGEGARSACSGFAIAADGSYAARLVPAGDGRGRTPERWTLDGPEPYAVPLPGPRPEGPGTEVSPLSDGRVLIRRKIADRHHLALLYPTGPGTGELHLGTVERDRLWLLPPTPRGASAHALSPGERGTTVWLVHGGPHGPEPVAEVSGRCSGGVWLDREGRLLALDRTDASGRTKTVVVDLERGGEVSPLLQITDDSDDRLLLADPDSGLLLVRSDAPGEARLGWGVLGSHRPVRFPDALRPPGVALTPFAVQPGQALDPEGCAVALRVDGPNGTWVAVWWPARRRLRHLAAPPGWVRGTGLWTTDGELRLPYAGGQTRCGLARVALPRPEPEPPAAAATRSSDSASGSVSNFVSDSVSNPAPGPVPRAPAGPSPHAPFAPFTPLPRPRDRRPPEPAEAEPIGPPMGRPLPFRPVPLQQAPLARNHAERRS